jgi:plastocyanin
LKTQPMTRRPRTAITVRRFLISLALLRMAVPLPCFSQAKTPTARVHGRVQVIGLENIGKNRREAILIPKTVVWLTPLVATDGDDTLSVRHSVAPNAALRLVQKNKSFEPHILVVPAGSAVEFPNHDPFFHNVFSLFEGKRFDLGLYEAGSSRMVQFDRPGISYIFCNIHPEMSAVVITLTTTLYDVSNQNGLVTMAGVPYGRYLLHIWSEGMGPENSPPVTREVAVAENTVSLGTIQVPEVNSQSMAHKNKYGRDYDEPTPNNSVYDQPH